MQFVAEGTVMSEHKGKGSISGIIEVGATSVRGEK